MAATLTASMKLLKPKEIERVFELLAEANPAPATELESLNVYTLLVAVVLSAQMTDRGVNRATGPLFAIVSTPEAMLALGEEGLKGYIKSVNLLPDEGAPHHRAFSDPRRPFRREGSRHEG